MFRWFDIMTTNCGVDAQWKGNNNHTLYLLLSWIGEEFSLYIMHHAYDVSQYVLLSGKNFLYRSCLYDVSQGVLLDRAPYACLCAGTYHARWIYSFTHQ